MTEKTTLDRIYADPNALVAFLSSKWKEVYSALDVFQNYVKHTTTILFGVITVVSGGFVLLVKTTDDLSILKSNEFELAGIMVLIIICAFSIISIYIIKTAYRLYVSALIDAARVHHYWGMANNHWLEKIVSITKKNSKHLLNPDFFDNDDNGGKTKDHRKEIDNIIKVRMKSSHAYALYKYLFVIIAVLSFLFAAYLVNYRTERTHRSITIQENTGLLALKTTYVSKDKNFH
jgi:hypothetical protein